MFVSIKKYLNSGPEATLTEILLRSLSLLIEGIGLHAVRLDESDHERFQTDVAKASRALSGEVSSTGVLVATGELLHSLEHYGQQTSRFIRAQSVELQAMVTMLTETLVTISGGSERSVSRLQEIEKRIEKSTVIEDMRTVRTQLSSCLENLRDEVKCQREATAQYVAQVTQGIQQAQARTKAVLTAPSTDSLTCLPDHIAAEGALTAAVQHKSNSFVAIFVVSRVRAINDRFGLAAGDQVMISYSQHLAQALSQNDQLFRWRGPSFLALLEREWDLVQVRHELARIGSVRMEKTFEVGQRSVMLPVTATWAVYPLLDYPSESAIVRKVEEFVSQESQK